MSQVIFTDRGISKLISIPGADKTVFLSLAQISRNNLVDMGMYVMQVMEATGLKEKTIQNSITNLVKNDMLLKCQIPKVYFIPSQILMHGHFKSIYKLQKMVLQKDKYLLEQAKTLEELDARMRSKDTLKSLTEEFESRRNSVGDLEYYHKTTGEAIAPEELLILMTLEEGITHE